MSQIPAPWSTWWQEDLPCFFSQQQTARNRDFLTETLGQSWLQKALGPTSQHPLVIEWMTAGANSFLQLNALAEDIRILQSVRGLDAVLEDLRLGEQSLSTWHVLRAAAMFCRAGARVDEFFAQSSVKVPDFSLSYHSVQANVEAKLLTTSEIEESFHEYAKPILDRIFVQIMNEERLHPPVSVIIKDALNLPVADEVIRSVEILLKHAPGQLRNRSFNIFVEAPLEVPTTLYKRCYILCPRSNKEDLRVSTRIRDASHQLQAQGLSTVSGIACVGMTQQQDPIAVRGLLLRKFRDGQYSGVSAAILLLSGTHIQPPRRSVIDLFSTISNPKSHAPLPLPFPFKALDFMKRLEDHFNEPGIPAYRVLASQIRKTDENVNIRLDDVRRISPDLLK